MPSVRCCALAAGLTSVLCAQAPGQAYVVDVGFLPPGRNFTQLSAVSDNGAAAAGWSELVVPNAPPFLEQAVRWTPAGMVGLGENSGFCYAMSSDGSVLVGTGYDPVNPP